MNDYDRLEAEFRGKVTAEIKNIKNIVHDAVKDFRESVRDSIEFMAKTKERLKTGNKKFEEIDEKFKEMENKNAPTSKKVYALIILGFLVLGFLVSFKGCTKGIKYYDSESDKCDSTKHKCIDVRGIK